MPHTKSVRTVAYTPKSFNLESLSRSSALMSRSDSVVNSSVTPSTQENLCTRLWQANQEKAVIALNSMFIQGIKAGNLDPVTYAQYFLQDCIYCFKAIETFKILAQRTGFMQTSYAKSLSELAEHKVESYTVYTKAAFSNWRIKTPEGIELSETVIGYSDFEREAAIALDSPIYILLSALPCLRLWPWIAQQIKDSATEKNLYRQWILDNLSDASVLKLEQYIDTILSPYIDERIATAVYECAILHECNFFLTACKQDPLPNKSLRERLNGSNWRALPAANYSELRNKADSRSPLAAENIPGILCNNLCDL